MAEQVIISADAKLKFFDSKQAVLNSIKRARRLAGKIDGLQGAKLDVLKAEIQKLVGVQQVIDGLRID